MLKNLTENVSNNPLLILSIILLAGLGLVPRGA